MRLCHDKSYVIGNGENYFSEELKFVTNYQIPSEFLKKKDGKNCSTDGENH